MGWDGKGSLEARLVGYDQNPDAIAVFEGEDLVCRAANAALSQMVGRDIVGQPLRQAMADLAHQELFELYERVLATGEPAIAHNSRFHLTTGDGQSWEVFVDFSLVPWRHDGAVRGVIARAVDVTSLVRQRQDAEEHHRRYEASRDLITVMQAALLPHDLPIVPGLDLAARYRLASEDTAVGGDWFDAVVRPDGRVALAVGDVVGHGVRAAAVMGQLRAVLCERLQSPAPLAEALQALDRFAAGTPGAKAATVCVVEVDPVTGTGTYCTAGHPAPLVLPTAAEGWFAEPSGAQPLGTFGAFPVRELTLAPGDLVLLYTDGIIQRPQTSPAHATVELARVAGATAANRGPRPDAPSRATERVCQLTLELLTRVTGHSDDITLFAAQRVPAGSPVDLRLAAEPTAPRAARAALETLLEPLDVRDDDIIAATHAVSELVTNAVEHAYAPPPDGSPAASWVHVTAVVDGAGSLECRVRDWGRWRPAGDDDRATSGRGLGIVAAFADETTVTAAEDGGTVATFRRRLSRPAPSLVATRGVPSPRHAAMPYAATYDTQTATLHVAGAVDKLAVDDLRIALQGATRGFTRPIAVDLGSVTHLGSNAVQLLLDHPFLRLIAPEGSVAGHVLDLVRIAYDPA